MSSSQVAGPPSKGVANQGTDNVPDLGPALAAWARKGERRMLAFGYRDVGIVIELDKLAPPPQNLREAVGQHDPERIPQSGTPQARSGYLAQLWARMRSPISPPPASQSEIASEDPLIRTITMVCQVNKKISRD